MPVIFPWIVGRDLPCWFCLLSFILSISKKPCSFFQYIYIVAVGQRGRRPCIQAFGANLFDGGRPWGERRQKITWADFLDLGFPVSWWFLHWFSSCLDLKLIVIRPKKEIASLRELVRFSLLQRGICRPWKLIIEPWPMKAVTNSSKRNSMWTTGTLMLSIDKEVPWPGNLDPPMLQVPQQSLACAGYLLWRRRGMQYWWRSRSEGSAKGLFL